MRRYFPDLKNFLEIGCGTGFVLSGVRSAFPRISLYGGDIYVEGLTYVRKRLDRVELFQIDACKLPFENAFDVIGAFDVLEHIKDDKLALLQMYQAVRKGGGIILTVPQHDFLWSRFDDYSCHIRRYNKAEFKAKVEEAGFKVMNITSFVSLLMPFMLFSRLRHKRKPCVEDDAGHELKMRGLTNTILEKVLGLERALIRLGVTLPFGGSLLLIAHKG